MSEDNDKPSHVGRQKLLGSVRRLVDGPTALLTPWRDLDLDKLWRLLLHAVIVGMAAGAITCMFFYALEWVNWLTLDNLVRLHAPRAGGELHLTPPAPEGPTRTWMLFVLPAVGGLLCGALVQWLAPSAAGAGTDAYVEAFHRKAGKVSFLVPPVKIVASLITLGSGGVAGREGPIIQTAGGIGSAVASLFRLGPRERRILLVAGAAAGAGAMFRTPLGAALYAIEVLYFEDFETDAIMPSVIASVTAYSVVTVVFGTGHLFTTEAHYIFDPRALPLYAALGLVIALFGVVYVRFLHRLGDSFFERLPVPLFARTALGGVMLGAFALIVPHALGTGYGMAQSAIDGASWITSHPLPWLFMLGLALVKTVGLGFTVQSGGSGGEMGPSLVIGALVGGAVGMLFHDLFPEIVTQPGAFALVGMGAFFGGVANVPISAAVMVCELCGSYDLLAPLILVCGISFVALRRVILYRAQVRGRMDSPAHRDELTIDILRSLTVQKVYDANSSLARVRRDTPAKEVLRQLVESDVPSVLVEDRDGACVGVISLRAVQGLMGNDALDGLLAADMSMPVTPLRETDDLHVALRAFLDSEAVALPVVDEAGALLGVLTHADVDVAYERAVSNWLDADLEVNLEGA
ncbi:MAG: chloride channel protein [Deltaproteobacteria bacterium]|nr:chloride channel protein [Deltaproteobacteria bacterium]